VQQLNPSERPPLGLYQLVTRDSFRRARRCLFQKKYVGWGSRNRVDFFGLEVPNRCGIFLCRVLKTVAKLWLYNIGTLKNRKGCEIVAENSISCPFNLKQYISRNMSFRNDVFENSIYIYMFIVI
jgi:hypothetical protein